MALNTLTLTIDFCCDGRTYADLIGEIRGWDGEIIGVAESGRLERIKNAADYYVRSFENVKIETRTL